MNKLDRESRSKILHLLCEGNSIRAIERLTGASKHTIMRRFTRLTNAFSKKLENLAHQVTLHQMFYNFVRVHQTLRMTPAMAAGVADRLWEIGDIVAVIEAWEAEQAVAGITYQIGENRIGGGFYVKVLPRYSEPMKPVYGFKSRAEVEAWIEADRAKHRPGRRPKLAVA
jgi:hypothetical protein